jgi:hypothetical protein
MAFGISAGTALVLGAGAGLVGSAMQSDSGRKASNYQRDAASQASSLQQSTTQQQLQMQREQFDQQQALIREQMARDRQIYDTSRADQRLAREVGQGALRQYWTDAVDKGFQFDPNAFDPSRIMNDPGMQFRLDQGNKSAMRSINAGPTGTYSGAAAKALLDYNQGAASQEYGAAYGRAADAEARRKDQYQLRTNQLANLAGIGQTANQASQVAGQAFGQAGQNAVSGLGQSGSSYANNAGNALSNMTNAVGSNLIGAGNAQAANSLYQGNSWANAFNQGGSMLGRRGSFGGGSGGSVTPYLGWDTQFGLNGSGGIDR